MEYLKGAAIGELAAMGYFMVKSSSAGSDVMGSAKLYATIQYNLFMGSINAGNYVGALYPIAPLLVGGFVYWYDPSVLSSIPLWGSAALAGLLVAVISTPNTTSE